MTSNERQKLYKRAATLRKTSRRSPRHERAEWDGEEDVQPRKRPSASLEELVLKLLEQEEAQPQAVSGPTTEGTVAWVGQGVCKVRMADGEVSCGLCNELAERQQSAIAVGDQALVDEHLVVRAILPRRTQLSRPDPANPNRERAIAANVDLVVITVSIKTPPLHPRLIDRYLVAIQKGGAAAVICVNKLDLALDEADLASELAKLDPYREAGAIVVGCSTSTGQGKDELQALMEGKTCAFVGHSGVGKSSVLNMLRPELELETGSVSEGYGRGRHTTTASSLYELSSGTRLIDTPGIRSFGLWKMTAEELASYFPEFEEHAWECRFRDCTHCEEPGCGVKAAIALGKVPQARYDTYRRLLAEVKL
jgi:ribosome biogenesis GTPase